MRSKGTLTPKCYIMKQICDSFFKISRFQADDSRLLEMGGDNDKQAYT